MLGVVSAIGHVPKMEGSWPQMPELATVKAGGETASIVPRSTPIARSPIARAGDPIDYQQAAYHGSPHDYEAIDFSKIGEGEGTADEGWGNYSSSDPQIGEWYRSNLAEVKGAGKPGSIRELDIPENDVLLDWHSPLSEQPPAVKAALERGGWLQGDRVKAWGITDIDGEPLGQDPGAIKGRDFYSWLSGELGSKRSASMRLNEAGIPGVKYADPRKNYSLPATGETPNSFVVWDRPSIKQKAKAGNLTELLALLRGT
jgi:hypothetical protein